MSTQATIYGVISTLDKYSTEDAKRILFNMVQDMEARHEQALAEPLRKANIYDQLDAYGCSTAAIWLSVTDELRGLREGAQGIVAAPRSDEGARSTAESPVAVLSHAPKKEGPTVEAPSEEQVETIARKAWEDGFALCRSYTDNHAHFSGEQKERQWLKEKEALLGSQGRRNRRDAQQQEGER